VDEIKVLKKKLGVDILSISDDLFIAHLPRLTEFCNIMMKEKVNMSWMCSIRANLVTEKMLRMMKKAGCVRASFGMESASPKILAEMKKGITPKQGKRTLQLCRKVGIPCSATFMVGMPSETKETFQESIDFCKDLGIATKFFYTCPYPGTELYEQVKHKIPNEEEFILKLGDAHDFAINLTDMSDEELIAMKEAGERELERYCMKPSILARRLIENVQARGLRNTVQQSFVFLKRIAVG
jgi:radical SAM superfamily enzyme YgiQ (UPF0313 family)